MRMELELYRVDYTIVGLTAANCMKLLPPYTSQETQKVAIADSDGILQIFSVKKDDIQLHFKTLPGPKVSSVQLGGATGTIVDKIFVAAENEVRGYTKKGKLFLSFDSSLTEPIISMFVLENDLFLCGRHVYNHYRDCKDVGSYLCGDRIVDVVAFYSEKTRRLISLIACEGRMIRALEHSRVTLTMEVDSAPTCLHIFKENDRRVILFGTVDGRIGLLDVEHLQGFQRWLISNKNYDSAISCMTTYDFDDSGRQKLILGRQDGNIEVYTINVEDEKDQSTLIYHDNCQESVTALQCGVVGTLGYDEIVVATYTGRVFGLTTEVVERSVVGDTTTGNSAFAVDTSHKIGKLKSEIDEMQQRILKEREKYQSSTISYFDEMSAIPLLDVNDSMVLSKDTSTYTLSIELPMPIDNILIQSDVLIDLLDVEKNSAVVSYSESSESDGNFLLATYRCQLNTNRLELKIRTCEGRYGIMKAYVTPIMQPKCSRVRQFIIKPLSLHYRIHNFDEKRPLNTLIVKGSFSLAEMHTWIYLCLPEVSERPIVQEKSTLMFQSTFLNTVLQCEYHKGEAEFKSDNVRTISIIKEFITKEATKKKIRMEFSTNINDECIGHVIKLFEDQLKSKQELSKKIAILEALNELEISEEDTVNSLSSKYKDFLSNERDLRKEFKTYPDHLERLYEVICALYVDYHQFKGNNVRSKIPRLMEILKNYDYNTLLAFFRPDIMRVY